MGREVGLSPLQALQSIACINGRPAIWGDAALAVELHQMEAAVVPPHLREPEVALPPGVVRLPVVRRARA